jgi:hypothetical protein
MKRIVALVVLVVAGAVGASVALAARGHHGDGNRRHHGNVIHVIEHATSDAVTNHADGAADSVGDVLTFTNDVLDQKNAQKVGSDQGYCVRMVVGQSWECVWTTFLPRGQLTVEGPFYDTKDSVLAITGGTEFDFIFHLIG